MRRGRVFMVMALLVFWVVVICGRLVWIQLIRHHYYVEQAAHEQEHSFEVAPRRGILYDRDLHELAMTVQVDSIYAVPSEIGAQGRRRRRRWRRSSIPIRQITSRRKSRFWRV